MAITTKAYGQFLLDLGTGVHNLMSDTQSVSLVSSSYTPDYTNHKVYTDFYSNELGATGSYAVGGAPLSNKTWTYNATSATVTLTADPITTWSNLTGTFRYAILYKVASGSKPLIACIDFGADRTYSGEPFQLSFTNGVVTIGG